ncbi:MAG: hypothetical protein DRH17_12715 [Deltaproteobacteria bacterium]|nr:MAG: hypothetical protein DRH17_12715 [Deltaproteobacteria bacterium]
MFEKKSRQGGSFFESGQISSCLLVANGIDRHEPGTRQCGIQATSRFVNGSGPYAKYGAVVGPVRSYQ